MFFNWRMDTQTVVHPYLGILPSINKERVSDTCNNMDESQKGCAE